MTQDLPIGVSSFSKLRNNNMVYIDKTAHAFELARLSSAFFLSRPRRFGKSLFVDTLKELFEGNQALFKDLFIHDKWDWSTSYPVIKLDFAAGVMQSRQELDEALMEMLQANQQRLGVSCQTQSVKGQLSELIRLSRQQFNQPVVILVDEYDKPILDNIDHPEIAGEVREGLKNLYSVMKAEDGNIRFIFMTGVTKFSKVSLFSGINQLKDLTLSPSFATICGYTQRDLESQFGPHLNGVDWTQLKQMYNGEAVYNPFDILLFVSNNQIYRNYWFETGSPSFLIKLFQQKQFFLPDLSQVEVNDSILDSFEVENINPVTLLFQTGYLTIDSTYNTFGELIYKLKTPNQEVTVALNNQLFTGFTDISTQQAQFKSVIFSALKKANMNELVSAISRLFAAIPWRNFSQNDLVNRGYYASVLYAFFASLNAEIIPEDITNHGQVDMTIKLGDFVYVIEIKLDKQAKPAETLSINQGSNAALGQIQARGYSQKYQQINKSTNQQQQGH